MRSLIQRLMDIIERLALRPWSRPAAAMAASIAKTVSTGHPHRIRYSRDGYWMNRQSGAVFYSPTLHSGSIEGVRRHVEDFWCHGADVGPGAVIIDIGAGIGDHVLVFSQKVGAQGRVVAIEAHPATARCLKLTVNTNHLANTSIVEEAAWDSTATLTMSDETGHEANAVGTANADIVVPARRVDDMLAPMNLPRIDLIKMNIEGAEVRALSGMPETLARARAVAVSCHDFLATEASDARRTKAQVIRILEDAGFTLSTRPQAQFAFLRDYVYGRRSS